MPTIFCISREEIKEMVDEMIEEKKLDVNLKLNREQIAEILTCIGCDELLARDIRMSIRGSIAEVLNYGKL
ncbi:MAG: hypothetical protein KAI67_00345 [Candidatus Pacebacteria bacterium]|nr:hypothetical protein [Candidatus Paceibacterota bacterium]